MNKFLAIAAAACAAAFAHAVPSPLAIFANADRMPLSYAVGDTAEISITATSNGVATVDVPEIEVKLFADRGVTEAPRTERVKAGEKIRVRLDAPGFVTATAKFMDGTPISARIALGAGVDSLPRSAEPADFDAVWADAVAAANAVDLSKAVWTPARGAIASKVATPFSAQTFTLPLGDGLAPATGVVVFPTRAQNGALTNLVVELDRYGMGSRVPVPLAASRTLGAHLDTHGWSYDLDAKQAAAKFNEISNGGVGGAYGFHEGEYDDVRKSYFYGMVVRYLAGLRLLRAHPLLADGTSATLVGDGQGAWGALALAALAPQGSVRGLSITGALFCDMRGDVDFGRAASWHPAWTKGLAYFDGVSFAARVSAPVDFRRVSLMGMRAPASSLLVTYNALRGPKRLQFVNRTAAGDETLALTSDWTDAAAAAASIPSAANQQ